MASFARASRVGLSPFMLPERSRITIRFVLIGATSTDCSPFTSTGTSSLTGTLKPTGAPLSWPSLTTASKCRFDTPSPLPAGWSIGAFSVTV
ncbi:hypothetical protein D3C71_1713830 [compost metagenome]